MVVIIWLILKGSYALNINNINNTKSIINTALVSINQYID
jgi:hypothetical protein